MRVEVLVSLRTLTLVLFLTKILGLTPVSGFGPPASRPLRFKCARTHDFR